MVTWELITFGSILIQLVRSYELRNDTLWKVPGRKFKNAEYYKAAYFTQRIYCISHCLDNIECNSIAWNEITKQCQFSNSMIMHDQLQYRRMDFDKEWNGYAIVKLSVFNAQSTLGKDYLTLDEAYKLCSDRGHRLASYSEMSAAHAEGIQLCACGWVSDGVRVIVQQRVTPICNYETKDGILECNGLRFEDLADAWCKVV